MTNCKRCGGSGMVDYTDTEEDDGEGYWCPECQKMEK